MVNINKASLSNELVPDHIGWSQVDVGGKVIEGGEFVDWEIGKAVGGKDRRVQEEET